MGRVLALHIAPAHGAPCTPTPEAKLVPGRGIEGDRHFGDPKPDQELTLIESETLVALERDHGIALTAAESRRQVLTEGVALNHLVGRRFRAGAVVLEGVELCEPCGHLERLTRKGVTKGLLHRGGLRARIVEGGVLRAGDPVAVDAAG